MAAPLQLSKHSMACLRFIRGGICGLFAKPFQPGWQGMMLESIAARIALRLCAPPFGSLEDRNG